MTATLPTGTVYGVLLNVRSEWDAWASRMHDSPYKAPPKAPVLYVKTANTFSPDGAAIPVPAHVPEVEIGATVGLVMGEAGRVQSCVLLADLAVPHASYFRPPVKFRNLDGFLGVGPVAAVADPQALAIEVRVDGQVRQTVTFRALVRDLPTLLADVGEFMTLGPGDVLMLGCAADRPRARVGERIELRCPGLGTLSHTLVAEAA